MSCLDASDYESSKKFKDYSNEVTYSFIEGLKIYPQTWDKINKKHYQNYKNSNAKAVTYTKLGCLYLTY